MFHHWLKTEPGLSIDTIEVVGNDLVIAEEIIILAGLQSIPQAPIESARIEGATEWQITRYIRLPMIKSLVLLVIMFRSIDTLKIFDLVWGITGGGPGISTEVVQTYSYRLAFGFLQMSKSMTVMILFSSVVISLTFFYSFQTSI